MKNIIVCDSGLGGLNIAAAVCRQHNDQSEPGNLIYFNAYPEVDMGFNKFSSPRAQEELFRVVLESMKKFSPDCCLIACNTLSIVYERLARWYTPGFPVTGIAGCAVDAIYTALNEIPDSAVIILGTKTTVESRCYADKLIDKGIAPERICGIPCPGVATLLESDPGSAEVADMIAGFAAQAPEIAGKTLYLALCCTHFEFAEPVWLEKFGEVFPGRQIKIVNPNKFAAGSLSADSFRYLSRIEFFPGAKEAMTEYFAGTLLADALNSAVADKDLFEFDPKLYL